MIKPWCFSTYQLILAWNYDSPDPTLSNLSLKQTQGAVMGNEGTPQDAT